MRRIYNWKDVRNINKVGVLRKDLHTNNENLGCMEVGR